MLTGLETKKLIKSIDMSIGDVCEELGMTRQNLHNHLKKDIISDSFYRLLKDKFPNHFKEEPIYQTNNITSKPNEQMKSEHQDLFVDLMAKEMKRMSLKLAECQEELSRYKEVKPNAKHAS